MSFFYKGGASLLVPYSALFNGPRAYAKNYVVSDVKSKPVDQLSDQNYYENGSEVSNARYRHLSPSPQPLGNDLLKLDVIRDLRGRFHELLPDLEAVYILLKETYIFQH